MLYEMLIELLLSAVPLNVDSVTEPSSEYSQATVPMLLILAAENLKNCSAFSYVSAAVIGGAKVKNSSK